MSIQIQKRDLHVFEQLKHCRFLTLSQISVLCFAQKAEAAKKRLQKLAQAGFLVRFQPGFGSPLIYLLAKRGWNVAAGTHESHPGTLKEKPPGIATLRHDLAVRDCLAAFVRDEKYADLQLHRYSLKSSDLSFRVRGVFTRPDAYIEIIRRGEVSRFFVELDRGTEKLSILAHRVSSYREFFRSGAFATRCGGSIEDHKSYPFRIILIFLSERRLDSAFGKFRDLSIHNFVLGATLAQVTAQPLEAIWRSPRSKIPKLEPSVGIKLLDRK